MDEIAEKGVAAHYKYKEGFKQNSDDRNFEQWVSKIRKSSNNNKNLSTTELLDNIKLNLYSKEVLFSHQKEKLKFYQWFYRFRFCVFGSHRFGNEMFRCKNQWKTGSYFLRFAKRRPNRHSFLLKIKTKSKIG